MSDRPSILITGAGGYVGRAVVRALAALDARVHIVATDLALPPDDRRVPEVDYRVGDVCSDSLLELMAEVRPRTVVHLASIVTPGKDTTRDAQHAVDVDGTARVLRGCVAYEVEQIIVTSSGAAYGYHADNPQPLVESDPLRGNEAFAYSDHKRLVEEMLAHYRVVHPELKQLVFRPGTILGSGTRNQITRLWDGKSILGFTGTTTPYVFIWDEDVVACIVKGVVECSSGIYNLAGDGTMTSEEIARKLGKRYVALPVVLVKAALLLGKAFGLSAYGPEQTMFLQYRPVLSNEKLKREFGYTPKKTTREVFDYYAASR